jgi:hypothetical protein
MTNRTQCPRCRASQLRAWPELSDEEQEVVKRLPSSADFALDDRKARHRWCTRCWYEDKGDALMSA